MHQCEYCSASFPSFYSLRSHKNGSTKHGIPKCARAVSETIDASPDAADDVAINATVADIKTSIFMQHEICQRHQMDAELGSPCAISNIDMSVDTNYTVYLDRKIL